MLSDLGADLDGPGPCLLVSLEAKREAEALTAICQDAVWCLGFAQV